MQVSATGEFPTQVSCRFVLGLSYLSWPTDCEEIIGTYMQ